MLKLISYSTQTQFHYLAQQLLNNYLQKKIEVTVYPNSTKNNATVELNLAKEETVTINVLSVMGPISSLLKH